VHFFMTSPANTAKFQTGHCPAKSSLSTASNTCCTYQHYLQVYSLLKIFKALTEQYMHENVQQAAEWEYLCY